jgi:hypothetical protein
MLLKKLHFCLLGAALATSVLATGCQPAPQTEVTTQPAQPAQPAQPETVIYNRWETETHRPHKEIAQRPQEEQKAYHDWRQQHPEIR